MNHYETLGVPINATPTELKRAWKALCSKLHPDRNDAPEAAVRMAQVNEAYRVLSDEALRANYDHTGASALPEKLTVKQRATGMLLDLISQVAESKPAWKIHIDLKKHFRDQKKEFTNTLKERRATLENTERDWKKFLIVLPHVTEDIYEAAIASKRNHINAHCKALAEDIELCEAALALLCEYEIAEEAPVYEPGAPAQPSPDEFFEQLFGGGLGGGKAYKFNF